MILKSFQDIANLNMSKLESGTTIPITIVDVNNPGKYDLILTYIRESVSGTEYFKGVIISNPNNESFDTGGSRSAPVNLFNLYRPTYKGRKLDIVTLFPADILVKGHIPMKSIAGVDTVLNHWDKLTALLNETFIVKTSAQAAADTGVSE